MKKINIRRILLCGLGVTLVLYFVFLIYQYMTATVEPDTGSYIVFWVWTAAGAVMCFIFAFKKRAKTEDGSTGEHGKEEVEKAEGQERAQNAVAVVKAEERKEQCAELCLGGSAPENSEEASQNEGELERKEEAVPQIPETNSDIVERKEQFISAQKTERETGEECRYAMYRKVSPGMDVLRAMRKRFISVHVETTGTDRERDKIVELGAVIFENGIPTKRYQSFVDIGRKKIKESYHVEQIDREDLEWALPMESALHEFAEFISDAMCGETLVATYAAYFSCDFICNALEREQYTARFASVECADFATRFLAGNEQGIDMSSPSVPKLEKLLNIPAPCLGRADDAAERYGRITLATVEASEKELLKMEAENEEKKAKKTPTEEGVEVCRWIRDAAKEHNAPIEQMRIIKRGSDGIQIGCPYCAATVHLTKTSKYITLPADKTEGIQLAKKDKMSGGEVVGVNVIFETEDDIRSIGDVLADVLRESARSTDRMIARGERTIIEIERDARKMYAIE